jgi:periplasmic divalent cation tolerance protein
MIFSALKSPYPFAGADEMSVPQLVVAITTFAEEQHAVEMAERVVQQGAAACAQIDGPIQSVYRWEGQLCRDAEWRLTLKSTRSALARLQKIVLEHHPYDQPQWLVLNACDASPGYANWVEASTVEKGRQS